MTKRNPSPSTLLTARQAAERLGISVKTLHRWVDAGRLVEAAKLPGQTGARLFDPVEVERCARSAA